MDLIIGIVVFYFANGQVLLEVNFPKNVVHLYFLDLEKWNRDAMIRKVGFSRQLVLYIPYTFYTLNLAKTIPLR